MTRVKGNLFIVEPEGICEFCGCVAELRPYGPNNERICIKCGMKDKETTERKILELMKGKVLIDGRSNEN